jgi:hypothetical protein
MDHMLKNFQNNLANISNEIRHLQQYSAELNIKKKNREVVREQLSQVVDEMVVPQSMIQYDEFIDEIMCVFFFRSIGLLWMFQLQNDNFLNNFMN